MFHTACTLCSKLMDCNLSLKSPKEIKYYEDPCGRTVWVYCKLKEGQFGAHFALNHCMRPNYPTGELHFVLRNSIYMSCNITNEYILTILLLSSFACREMFLFWRQLQSEWTVTLLHLTDGKILQWTIACIWKEVKSRKSCKNQHSVQIVYSSLAVREMPSQCKQKWPIFSLCNMISCIKTEPNYQLLQGFLAPKKKNRILHRKCL